MSTRDHRSRSRHPTHPSSRSPSPTVVGSERAPSRVASTISLPRHEYQDYDQPRYLYEEAPRRQNKHNTLAKAAIVVGIVGVVAGALHLWRAREAERSQKIEREFEKGRRRVRRRERRAQRDFEEWREGVSRPAIGYGYGYGAEPSSRGGDRRLDDSGPGYEHGNERGDWGDYGGRGH